MNACGVKRIQAFENIGDQFFNQIIWVAIFTIALMSPLFPAFNLPSGTYMSLLTFLIAISGVFIVAKGYVLRHSVLMFMLMLAFFAWMTLGLAWTPAPEYGMSKLLTFVLRSLLPAAALLLLVSGEAYWRKARLAFVFLSIVSAIPAILQLGDLGVWDRFSLGGNPIWYGRMLALAALCAGTFAYETSFLCQPLCRRASNLAIYLLLTIIFSLAVLSSGSRGPFWLLIGTLLIQAILALRTYKWHMQERMSAIAIAGIVIIFFLSIFGDLAAVQHGPADRIMSLLHDPLDTSSIGRTERQITAWNAIKSAPIMGYGIGASGIFLAGTDDRAYAHNLFLEIWLESGIIGLSLFLVIQGWTLRILYSWLEDRKIYAISLAPMWLYTFGNALVSGDLGANYEIWVLVAVIIAMAYDPTKQSKTE
ncbi:MAG: O-antigen ligase family protein [Actinobacteria bacterium]|nr:O-antigen ligase family protein [Actinomycetota bacterium]